MKVHLQHHQNYVMYYMNIRLIVWLKIIWKIINQTLSKRVVKLKMNHIAKNINRTYDLEYETRDHVAALVERKEGEYERVKARDTRAYHIVYAPQMSPEYRLGIGKIHALFVFDLDVANVSEVDTSARTKILHALQRAQVCIMQCFLLFFCFFFIFGLRGDLSQITSTHVILARNILQFHEMLFVFIVIFDFIPHEVMILLTVKENKDVT